MENKISKEIKEQSVERFTEKVAQAIYFSKDLPFYSTFMPDWEFLPESLKKDLLRIAKPAAIEFLKISKED